MTAAELMAKRFPPRNAIWQAMKEYAATHLDGDPQYEIDDEVPIRGEGLHKVIWCGRQWAVTEYGLECRDGTYAIEKDRLWENEKEHGWVRQMAGKNWTDMMDFIEALRLARHHHVKS